MARPSLYVIDGHAQIYRAYYAPFPNLTAPGGEPTRATHVFCQVLINLLRDRKPDYVVMALDTSDETVFRCAIDPQYKAHREPPPEDFTPQKDRILQIVEALNIPIIKVPGFEADDIMATLADRYGGKEADVYLVSKDKDLEQVLRDGVYMYDVGKGTVIDAAEHEKNKGYPPSKAVEAQMLMGDSVDNVKGADGVGPKKAADLLSKYGDVKGIIANADKLTPKLRERILEFADRAETVRQLVTLRLDTPFEFKLDDAAVARLKHDSAHTIFRELNFNRLTDQLDQVFGVKSAPAATGSGAAASASSGGAAAKSGSKSAGSGAERAGDDAPLFALAEEDAAGGESRERMSRGDYVLIDSEAGLKAFAAKLATCDAFAFDTETTSLNVAEAALVGLSFSWESGKGWYVATGGIGQTVPLEQVKKHLGPILADSKIKKCGQNLKYDIGVLMTAGLPVRGVWFDTMIASFVLDSARRSHGIDFLALDLLDFRKIPTSALIGSGKTQTTFDKLETTRVCPYACEDADIAWQLTQLMAPQIAGQGFEKLFDELEMPLVQVLATIEHNGVTLDCELLRGLSTEMAARLEQLTHDIYEKAGHPFNIDSTKQLAEVLFDELKLPVVKKTKTARSTDAEVLQTLSRDHEAEVPKLVLEYRELSKLKGTYIDTLPTMVTERTGRVHCSFHQTGAITGRLSSSDPNLQNIPIRTEAGAKIRRAFIPHAVDPKDDTPHKLISADYSQVELRVLAHFSEDANLIRAFTDDRDIHQFVASQIFGVPLEEVSSEMRGRAKTVNFGIIYGQTAFGLSRQTEMSVGEAKKFIEQYFAQYPQIQAFMDKCVQHARDHGYVETMLGRRRAIADIESRNQQARNAAERLAVNTVVQGTAADIIKRAMNNIYQRIAREALPMRMLIQVHDELVFETPVAHAEAQAKIVQSEMSSAVALRVPLKVDVGVGSNWLDAK